MEAPHHHCRHQSIFQVSEEMFHQIAGVSGSFLSYRPSFIRYKSSGHDRSLCIKSKLKNQPGRNPLLFRLPLRGGLLQNKDLSDFTKAGRPGWAACSGMTWSADAGWQNSDKIQTSSAREKPVNDVFVSGTFSHRREIQEIPAALR